MAEDWKKRATNLQERLKNSIGSLLSSPVGEPPVESRLRALHEERARKALDDYGEKNRATHVEDIADVRSQEFEHRKFKPLNRRVARAQAEAEVPLPLILPGSRETVGNYLNLLCNVAYEISSDCNIEITKANYRIKKLEAREGLADPENLKKDLEAQQQRVLQFVRIRNDLNYDWWKGMVAGMNRALDSKTIPREHYETLVDDLAKIGNRSIDTLGGFMTYDKLLEAKQNKLEVAREKEFLGKRRDKFSSVADGLEAFAAMVMPLELMATQIQNQQNRE